VFCLRESLMLGRVFKAYDIRGTYPDLLTDNMAWQIGFGVSQYLRADAAAAGETTPMMRNIVVGRDMRQSSPALTEALISGITHQGGDVIDVGMVDTSFMYWAVNYLDCAGGVVTTASHNPPQYNGFKIAKRKARPVGEHSGLQDVRKYAAMVERGAKGERTGRVEQRDMWDAYRKHVLSFLDLSSRKGGDPLKVVVDASNAMAGTMVPKVFGRRTGTVEGLHILELNYDNSSGQFAHEPNPLVPANLAQLQEAVLKQGADLGLCFDGDADRCAAVDEKGQIIGSDHLTALLARHFLADHEGSAIVFDLRSSKSVAEEILAAGGRPVRSRVGHVFMKERLAQERAVFGGELSGHYYFQGNYNADSGAIAMATILTVLARAGKPLSQLIKPIARYEQSGEINFEVEEKDEALAALKQRYARKAQIDELDGVTVDAFRKDGWWFNVRKSNTEPLVRLNAEARDGKTLERIVAELTPQLGRRVDH
jgi:phosphomannomutase